MCTQLQAQLYGSHLQRPVETAELPLVRAAPILGACMRDTIELNPASEVYFIF